MWPPRASPSLSRQIVASVALGLALILLLYGLVALWTIRESMESAYRERVALAQALGRHVDDVLRYALVTLEREAAYLGIEPDRALTEDERHRVADLRLRVGSFAILSVVDAAGTTLWTDPSRADVDIGRPLDHPSVHLALRTGEPQIIEFPSPVDPDIVFACLAVPLRAGNGRITGVLMAELDPRHAALNLLPSQESDEGTRVELMNSGGRLLASTTEFNPRTAMEHRALLAGLMLSGSAGYVVHEPPPEKGVPSHLVAYAPLALLPTWGILVEQPQDVVLAVPNRLQQRLAVFGVLALLLAVAVAWFDVRRVVRPLQHLTAAADRFAGGQLDESVRVDRADELGILARAFETMRQRLRTSLTEIAEWNRELEHRVATRTAELETRNRERAELLERLMTGQEEERKRLAQELHDDTSQALASLRLGLERLETEIAEPQQARRLASQLQGVAAETLDAVHRLAVELRPGILDDVGLVTAIERYCQECAQSSGLAVDFLAVGADHQRLLSAAETAIYRIVQAALTNVVQHAQARHVSVLLQRRDERLVVVVEDDGRGFDVAAMRAAPLRRRLGLAGMEERASLIGATLTIESEPDAGTALFLDVPLDLNREKEGAVVEAADSAG